MNRNYVLDSSVYAKLLIPEEDSERAERLFAEIVGQGGYILVPSIFLYEVIGVFRKHGCDRTTIEEFIDRYYTNKSYIRAFDLEGEIIGMALKISGEGTMRSGFPSFCDATYHALAIRHGCDFVTADRRHYVKTKNLGNIKLLADTNEPAAVPSPV